MNLIILSLRTHEATATKHWLEGLEGPGTAYLTDTLYAKLPEGGRLSLYPEGPEYWEELARPGDLKAAREAAAGGADILYRYPALKRRRVFVHWPGKAPGTRRKPYQRAMPPALQAPGAPPTPPA